MKVPRGFESHPLRTRVLSARKISEKSAESTCAGRLVSSKPTREMPTREVPMPFAEILSLATFGGGLWLSQKTCQRSQKRAARRRARTPQGRFDNSAGIGPSNGKDQFAKENPSIRCCDSQSSGSCVAILEQRFRGELRRLAALNDLLDDATTSGHGSEDNLIRGLACRRDALAV